MEPTALVVGAFNFAVRRVNPSVKSCFYNGTNGFSRWSI
jgi:hypothetical protein